MLRIPTLHRSYCPVDNFPGGHTSDIQSAPKCSDWGWGHFMPRQAPREYHLICRTTGHSHGGFETLAGARQYAREEALEAWDIFQGNLLVERHEPRRVEFAERKTAPQKPGISLSRIR